MLLPAYNISLFKRIEQNRDKDKDKKQKIFMVVTVSYSDQKYNTLKLNTLKI